MRKKKIAPLVVLLVVVSVIGLLFLVTLLGTNTDGLFNFELIRSETVYVVLVLMFLLLATAIVFLVAAIKSLKNKPDRKSEYDNVTVSADPLAGGNGSGEKDDDKKKESVDGQPRFARLTEIDEERKKQKTVTFDNGVTLKDLCEDFRNFCAGELKLYYTPSHIRQFVSGLSVSHILLMQGMSGTGKTSLAVAFGHYLKNESAVIPIQPMWKERTDLLGYYNEFTRKFNETGLLEKMYEANGSKEIFITVLDEMNIARVEYYFAEFLSMLELPENSDKNLDIVTDVWENDPKGLVGGKIPLPANMWFIGTANNDDSTFVISDKVYDRAMVMNLDDKCKPFDAPKTTQRRISSDYFKELCKSARTEYAITERSLKRIGKLDEYMIDRYHVTFGNRIMKQIKEYVPVMIACGGDEIEAIDDILAKKVLRKLESQNPIYVKDTIGDLCNYLDEVFGTDKMVACKKYLHRLDTIS